MLVLRLVVAVCMVTALLQNGDAFAPKIALRQTDFTVLSMGKSNPMRAARHLQMAVTDSPTKMETTAMGGMFTNSSPDTKRVVPTNMEGKTKFKIVYVVLESQYQSALTKACNSINEGKEGVAVEAVGYLLEELRSPAILEQFKADVADANIFIGSLIFVQELADKVNLFPSHLTFLYSFSLFIHAQCISKYLTPNESSHMQVVEVLTPQRDRMDAVLIFPSMPEVNMSLTSMSMLSYMLPQNLLFYYTIFTVINIFTAYLNR